MEKEGNNNAFNDETAHKYEAKSCTVLMLFIHNMIKRTSEPPGKVIKCIVILKLFYRFFFCCINLFFNINLFILIGG